MLQSGRWFWWRSVERIHRVLTLRQASCIVRLEKRGTEAKIWGKVVLGGSHGSETLLRGKRFPLGEMVWGNVSLLATCKVFKKTHMLPMLQEKKCILWELFG